MARHLAGRDQDGVEADVAETVRAGRGKPGFRRGDALTLARRHRFGGIV